MSPHPEFRQEPCQHRLLGGAVAGIAAFFVINTGSSVELWQELLLFCKLPQVGVLRHHLIVLTDKRHSLRAGLYVCFGSGQLQTAASAVGSSAVIFFEQIVDCRYL